MTKNKNILPGLWFVMLGVVIALLVGMVFLVVAEALVPSGSLPGPVYLLRGTRKFLHRTRRYGQIFSILLRYGLLPYLRGGRRAELGTAEGRARLAHSLRLALDAGGVTFVKLGQLLSTRRDLLPIEFVEEFSGLQDDAAQVPWLQLEQVLHAEPRGGVDELFGSFERTPLAAASVAQVHAATLISGQPVVVKVCRPGVRTVMEWDLDIIARLARTLQRSTRWGHAIGTIALAHAFADALREELDLRIEVGNMIAVAAASGDGAGVRIPVPYQPLCTEQVLVMQRLDGVPITAADDRIDMLGVERATLARTLLDTLLRQVMISGVFHADPHPGNILLLADGQLGLLDFGSVGRIDAGLRASLQRLLLAVDRGDPTRLSDALLELVERTDEFDELRLERALGRFLVRYVGPGLPFDGQMFADLFRIVSEHGLGMPAEMAAVFRAIATLEGTLTQLAPASTSSPKPAPSPAFTSPSSCVRTRCAPAPPTSFTALLPVLRRLPRRLDRIADSLEAGRLGLNVRLLADKRDRRVITELLHQVLITFLASTTGIMAVLMLGLRGGPRLTAQVSLHQFLGYSLLAISAILALRILVLVFRPDRT